MLRSRGTSCSPQKIGVFDRSRGAGGRSDCKGCPGRYRSLGGRGNCAGYKLLGFDMRQRYKHDCCDCDETPEPTAFAGWAS
jgi:hypothetical protein